MVVEECGRCAFLYRFPNFQQQQHSHHQNHLHHQMGNNNFNSSGGGGHDAFGNHGHQMRQQQRTGQGSPFGANASSSEQTALAAAAAAAAANGKGLTLQNILDQSNHFDLMSNGINNHHQQVLCPPKLIESGVLTKDGAVIINCFVMKILVSALVSLLERRKLFSTKTMRGHLSFHENVLGTK